MAGVIKRERILELAMRSMFGTENVGICTACGYEQDGCEPDAENYECEDCGERKVQGVENLLLGTVA
tara:strand:- start:1190 stop:1390 length:201 start_codon:yes stop_codon:yes gene_type:complete